MRFLKEKEAEEKAKKIAEKEKPILAQKKVPIIKIKSFFCVVCGIKMKRTNVNRMQKYCAECKG